MKNYKCCVFMVLHVVVNVICQDDQEKYVSEHELPKENIPTRPDYRGEGHWATPAPDSGIDLGFIPLKMYTQVRRSISVKHLPRSDALASATTLEEIMNAPRLKEVLSTKKISEVYSEEGYEDSAYDHGGFAKEAENHEDYDHREKGKHRKRPRRKKVKNDADDSESQGTDAQSQKVAASGEIINTEPRSSWKSHKVTKDETRLTFIDTPGEEAIPTKLMASYSHTIEHPDAKPTVETRHEVVTFNPIINDWQPVEQPIQQTVIPLPTIYPNTPIIETTNSVSTQIPQETQTQRNYPIFFLPIETTKSAPDQLTVNTNNQQKVPLIYLPIINSGTSENSYDFLRKQLYGSAFNDPYPLVSISNVGTNSENTQNDSVSVPKDSNYVLQNNLRQSLPSVHEMRTEKSTSSSVPSPQLGEPINTSPLQQDSLFRRKHPSIPIDEIHASQRPLVPVPIVQSNVGDISADVLNDREIGNKKSVPADGKSKVIHQEKKNINNPITTVKVNNDGIGYRDKIKNILQLTNATRENVQPHRLLHKTGLAYEKILTNENRHGNVNTKESLKPPSSDSNQDTSSGMLPLWAKFVEALTLEQYSKENSKYNDPRQHIKTEKHYITPTQRPFGHTDTKVKEVLKVSSEYSETASQNDKPFLLSNKPNLSKIVTAINDATSQSDNNEPRHLVVGIVTLKPENKESNKNILIAKPGEHPYRTENQLLASNSQVKRQTASRRMDDSYENPKYLSADEEESKLENEEARLEEEKDTEFQKNVNEWKEALENADKGLVPTYEVDTRKYPYYKSLPSNVISVHSPMRYATNPRDIPKKTEGKMAFYDSREDVYCPEVSPPQNVVPKRTSDGEWNKNPKPRLPRLKGLGDKIDCMRAKYFGTDPLDNPFFQESTVNIPTEAGSYKVHTIRDSGSDNIDSIEYAGSHKIDSVTDADSDKSDSITGADSMEFYAEIMDHIRNIGDIKKIPTLAEPTSGHQFIDSSESNEDEVLEGQRNFIPQEGQYGYETSQKTRKYPNVITNEYVSHTGHTEDYTPPIITYSEGEYPSLIAHNYRNITHDNLKHTPGLLTDDENYYEADVNENSENQPHQHSGDSINIASPPSSPDESHEGQYKSVKPEIILGMAPPPIRTPSYYIIKTVSRTPTSILSLLSNTPPARRPRKRRPANYNYRNIPGMIPPFINYPRNIIRNEFLRGNEIPAATSYHAAALGLSTGFLENPPNRINRTPINNIHDYMVAEETSNSQNISNIEGHQIRIGLPKEMSITTSKNLHKRARRAAVRRKKGKENIEDDEFSHLPTTLKRVNRRIDNERRGSKQNAVRNASVSGKQSYNSRRKGIQSNVENGYQYYDEIIPNNKQNKQKILDGDDDSTSSDYAATIEYDITHDADGPEARGDSQSEYDFEEPVAKNEHKYNGGKSGKDIRRGEPRYNDEDGEEWREKKILYSNRSNKRKNKNGSQTHVNESSVSKSRKNKSQGVLRNNKKNIMREPCDLDDDCPSQQSTAQDKIFDYDVNDEDDIQEYISVKDRPIFSSRTTSKGFVSPKKEFTNKEASNSSAVLEKLKNDYLLSKLKSKYPDGVMSAQQINQLLGGYMSRHNPSYSSKYNADENKDDLITTISPIYKNKNTTEPDLEPETLKDVNTHANTRSPSAMSKYNSSNRTRIIPILNAKVIPELVTSTHKPQRAISDRKRSKHRQENSLVNIESSKSKNSRNNTLRSNAEYVDLNQYDRDKTSKTDRPKSRNSTISKGHTKSTARQNATRNRGNGRASTTEAGSRSNDESSSNLKNVSTDVKISEKDVTTNRGGNKETRHWRLSRKGRDSNENVNYVNKSKESENALKQEQYTTNEAEQITNITNSTPQENSTEPIASGNFTAGVPRRLQAVEHRRVTEEEIFKTTYYPTKDLAAEMERQAELDAAALEEADDSEDYSEEEDDEDVHEPYESQKEIKHSRNRLEHQRGQSDIKPSTRDYTPYDGTENSGRPSQRYKPDESVAKAERSTKYNTSTRHRSKIHRGDVNRETRKEVPSRGLSEDGVKGLYLKKPKGPIESSLSNKRERLNDTKHTLSEVLTYYVHPETEEGEWVSVHDDDTFDKSDKLSSSAKRKENDQLKRSNNSEKSKPVTLNRSDVHETEKSSNKEELNNYNEDRNQGSTIRKTRDRTKNKSETKKEEKGNVNGKYLSTKERSRSSDIADRRKVNNETKARSKIVVHRQKENMKKVDDKVSDEDEGYIERWFGKGHHRSFLKDYDDDYDDYLTPTHSEKQHSRGNKGKEYSRGNKSRRYESSNNKLKDTIKSASSEVTYYEEVPDDTTNIEKKRRSEDYDSTPQEDDAEPTNSEAYEKEMSEMLSEIVSNLPANYKNFFDPGSSAVAADKKTEINSEETKVKIPQFIKNPGERKYYYVNDSPPIDVDENRRSPIKNKNRSRES